MRVRGKAGGCSEKGRLWKKKQNETKRRRKGREKWVELIDGCDRRRSMLELSRADSGGEEEERLEKRGGYK